MRIRVTQQYSLLFNDCCPLDFSMKFNLRWSKVLAAGAVIAMFLSVAFVAPVLISRVHEYRAAQLHPHPASDMEQLEVLRTVLKDDFFTSWQLPPPPPPPPLPPEPYEDKSIVLIGSSIGVCKKAPAIDRVEFGCIPARDLELDTEFVQDEPGIPPKLLQELFAANQVSSIIPDPHGPNILYRPRTVMEGLLTSADRFHQFYALFPHSKFAIEVSRAVLSDDGTHALIHVQLRFIGLAHGDQGVLYYLVRTGNAWRVEKVSGPSIY
jgi:hypothetical protein